MFLFLLPAAMAAAVLVTHAAARDELSPAARLGQKLFNDVSLSASGAQSCATCHVPAHAHAGSDGRAVPLGGPAMGTQGFRNAPSLRYLSGNTKFLFAADGTPTGGFAWDGRAASLGEQARTPLLAAHEMDNVDAAHFAQKLRRAAYVDEFRQLYGAPVLDDDESVFEHAADALGRFEIEAREFHPYDSKYDAVLAGRARLTAQEARGRQLFDDPQKGNCASCHPSKTVDGQPPLFTDFTYDALGVPRNAEIPATADSGYFDLGLCGPDRKDLAARRELCGKFKVPTLRNVALTAPYFHNGYFKTLEDAVAFYARRDTSPEQWYPRDAQGRVQKFNDLPPELRGNVNVDEVPYNRKAGDAPALSPQDIDDIVTFLQTLTDGWTP
ncbi:MAG TPA: cytochrome c peroxidase [Nevskiaceae bacterium]|nr:cytochrome c peroxidase [Nevskiaceae bacterium]